MEKPKTTVDTKNPMSELNIYRESNATCLHVVPK